MQEWDLQDHYLQVHFPLPRHLTKVCHQAHQGLVTFCLQLLPTQVSLPPHLHMEDSRLPHLDMEEFPPQLLATEAFHHQHLDMGEFLLQLQPALLFLTHHRGDRNSAVDGWISVLECYEGILNIEGLCEAVEDFGV